MSVTQAATIRTKSRDLNVSRKIADEKEVLTHLTLFY